MTIFDITNTYNDALIFCNLVETKSFSEVARRLGINQSTVSRRIQALEYELQVQLIHRSTRKINITDAGLSFYSSFVDKEKVLRQTVEDFKFGKADLAGKIRVSIPFGIPNYIIFPEIGKYLRANPMVNLDIVYHNRDIDLIKEAIDLAIVRQVPIQQTVKIKKIFELDLQLYCTPEYITRYGKPETLDDLEQHLLALHIKNNDFSDNLIKARNKDGCKFLLQNQSRLSINSTDAGKEIIRDGHVIVFGFDELYRDEESKGEVVKILPEYKFSHRDLYMVRLSNNNNSLIKHFMQFIEEQFAKLNHRD